MPEDTEPPRPNGLPIAITGSPIRILSESPNFTAGSGLSWLHAQHGEVDLRVLADDLSLEPEPVAEDHRDLVGVTDDVVVGDDDTGGVDHEAGAGRLRAALLRRLAPSPRWLRRLKNSSNRSPKGVSGPSCGSCGRLRPFWSLVVTAEMLTTAGDDLLDEIGERGLSRSAAACWPAPAPAAAPARPSARGRRRRRRKRCG